ncbi:CcdB family protein [Sphingomonas sp. QA11]|uniref:CcdB family protein n=1 Tax=Sphingomonas sp. QA11 TaxID=2950605 RepID=UPI00234AF7C6|nr:CcdB family protein [Sphingomonas sp. QA11]WCM29077.1 CcdB family protein [Sphingomonas sp. QA11]
MARFDVYRPKDSDELLLDCQADVLDELDSRFVVPLLPASMFHKTFARLNPTFEVEGRSVIMATQSAATIPVRLIGQRVTSLVEEQSTIMNAIDMLLTGY